MHVIRRQFGASARRSSSAIELLAIYQNKTIVQKKPPTHTQRKKCFNPGENFLSVATQLILSNWATNTTAAMTDKTLIH